MLGIADYLEQMRIAPRSAAVVGGAGAAARHATGVMNLWLGFQRFLDLDRVHPVVTEIVGKGEFLDAGLDNLAQLPFAGALHLHLSGELVAVCLALDHEARQMTALPAHAGL